jgi:RHS repeat-associated protein
MVNNRTMMVLPWAMRPSTLKARNQKDRPTMEANYDYDGLARCAYKVTGKERDAESGLDNFGARYDASSLGRFMTPDPLYIEASPPSASGVKGNFSELIHNFISPFCTSEGSPSAKYTLAHAPRSSSPRVVGEMGATVF